MSKFVEPQQGHFAARGSSVPRKHLPMSIKSEAGMIRDESTGNNLQEAPAYCTDRLCCQTLASSVVSVPPNISLTLGGSSTSASWSREAVHCWYRTQCICYPSVYCAFWDFIVSSSCAGNISTSDCPEVPSSRAWRTLPRQRSGTTFAITSSGTPWMSPKSLELL